MELKKLKNSTATTMAGLLIGLSATAAVAQDTPSWCGPNEASIAFLDGFGGNSWRQITTASAQEEAEKCPSVTDYFYADGQGDTQKAISDINSMAARGVNAIVVYGDAGPAILPALTNAYKNGAVVVPYRVDVGGEEGVNYSKYIGGDVESDGRDWGTFIKEQFPDGANIDFLSGPAGNSFGLALLDGLKQVLGDDERYVFLNPEPYHVTNWDPAQTQQVLTAEVAKHGADIDIILSDFGASLIGGLAAFGNSGLSIPAIATQDANILGCFWHDNQENNPDFKLLTTASGNDHGRLAVQWAVAMATGGTPPESDSYAGGVMENSVTGEPSAVQCRPDLPGDIYLNAEMAPEKQAEVIGQ
ncbi:substrate-binding domain-containing protein [Sinisalibacter aestuarii]|uniref:Periplasmic binding protein domain-containing protein n=1 Tax=Sinisalibacter aestuarii TaxID=2949426 RepID=A0ABQ5LRN5_9RHOB|nr:substrate-binding domain-containing protein [Sinisalibacter aestuarii]GKY87070.1 hypothetical protein STA1M1_09390 [Sinisalibacter aestuarii]